MVIKAEIVVGNMALIATSTGVLWLRPVDEERRGEGMQLSKADDKMLAELIEAFYQERF